VETTSAQPADSASCRDLLRDVAEGRPGAERALVDRFKSHVRRLLARTLGPGPDVDDRLQEVLMRVFARLHRVEPPEALPGFVTQVTIFVAREELRRRRRARWLSFFASDDLAAMGGGAEDLSEDVRAFYRALSKVSDEAHLLVTLRHVEGMSLGEIAEHLSISLATVKRHLARAESDVLEKLGIEDTSTAPWMRGAFR
jgi:RNA polymerase sigma-70 factor (ECF subfamily)